ncbi:MAG: hypothetical protein K8S27_08860 [Candidatus Omnitrophica bacterium]|nr:hypothetical protein [Candidatus Omnitrophota bacterium]
MKKIFYFIIFAISVTCTSLLFANSNSKDILNKLQPPYKIIEIVFIHDGGSKGLTIEDIKQNRLEVYFDFRMDSVDNAIYLFAYPDKDKSEKIESNSLEEDKIIIILEEILLRTPIDSENYKILKKLMIFYQK